MERQEDEEVKVRDSNKGVSGKKDNFRETTAIPENREPPSGSRRTSRCSTPMSLNLQLSDDEDEEEDEDDSPIISSEDDEEEEEEKMVVDSGSPIISSQVEVKLAS